MLPKLILIIEDHPDTQYGLAVWLRREGFHVTCLADAVSAVPVAGRILPDLVLLDLRLPGGDGIDLIPKLRDINPAGPTPIIVLTATSLANRERAMAAGATDFFQKPADNQELLAAIRTALSEE